MKYEHLLLPEKGLEMWNASKVPLSLSVSLPLCKYAVRHDTKFWPQFVVIADPSSYLYNIGSSLCPKENDKPPLIFKY